MEWATTIYKFLIALDWAFIMGFLASLATVGSYFLQKQHNIKSVKPIAEILLGDYEDRLVVVLTNNGTGPMIVKNLIVRDQAGKEHRSVIEFFRGIPDIVWKTFILDADGCAVMPGNRKVLIELVPTSTENWAQQRNQVRRVLKELTAQVFYEDIYENKMPSHTRDFMFFGRNLPD